jgi:hypothetical protein
LKTYKKILTFKGIFVPHTSTIRLGSYHILLRSQLNFLHSTIQFLPFDTQVPHQSPPEVNHSLTLHIGFVDHQVRIIAYFEQSMVTHFQGNITKPYMQPKLSLISTSHLVHNTPLKKVFDCMQPFPKLRTSQPLSGKEVLAMHIFFIQQSTAHRIFLVDIFSDPFN